MPAVVVRDLLVSYEMGQGNTYTPLRNVSFEVPEGSFVSIVGPSGCGKTTVLQAVAGLEPYREGEIHVHGTRVREIPPDIGYMFQRDPLLPWKTALDNVALAQSFKGVPRDVARQEAALWLKRVGLESFMHRYPWQLSGGMRKRVSLAQVLAGQPRLILMDEPFSALDVQTRALMENQLLELWAEYRKTILFITHDLDEALAMSDRIVVMTAGPQATVKSVYAVDLPRPRSVTSVRYLPHFRELSELLSRDLGHEADANQLADHERRMAE
jgi:NitT/TauT family transport system ATP-binding protein